MLPETILNIQWRRLHGTRGFYKWLGTGGTVSRRTANKKLTKLFWPSRKFSPKRLIVLLEPKSGGARPKKIFFRASVPSHFRSGPVPPFSNSFRRNCPLVSFSCKIFHLYFFRDFIYDCHLNSLYVISSGHLSHWPESVSSKPRFLRIKHV